MTLDLADIVIQALALPGGARVDHRVPKKMLAEHGAPTAADRRLLTDGLEEVQWVAALKPGTVAIPAFQDDTHEYLEIAVLRAEVRSTHQRPAPLRRLTALLHRAVPYPLWLLLVTNNAVELSLVHKRGAHKQAGKFILNGELVAVTLDAAHPQTQLLAALTLDRQPHSHLYALYQSWMDCLTAAQVQGITGVFTLAQDPDLAVVRRAALHEHRRLDLDMARLRKLAIKEKQLARRVELNRLLQQAQAEFAAALAQLT